METIGCKIFIGCIWWAIEAFALVALRNIGVNVCRLSEHCDLALSRPNYQPTSADQSPVPKSVADGSEIILRAKQRLLDLGFPVYQMRGKRKHHGGSGTSHPTARAGVPSIVVPFAGDRISGMNVCVWRVWHLPGMAGRNRNSSVTTNLQWLLRSFSRSQDHRRTHGLIWK